MHRQKDEPKLKQRLSHDVVTFGWIMVGVIIAAAIIGVCALVLEMVL